ncbi:transmembrane protein, putative (macronuclear) [Tetrahymena thermophila SB210]|uniref:Transmembrane protein, putative n=1 Tax=Tetrahymena thermophila (strain SB210) TaxID=312017 RepID=W7XKT1_TETTS|nr:transmembrane protein, putative [Tetrahymena thermophila SB210]EWS75189.1 transmembrane protein, putative [Tetrahymena thermophila SB210]|eukprot:XP_012652180.1 transmembrane protein, putative [Tetrahymena thermophila SB210]
MIIGKVFMLMMAKKKLECGKNEKQTFWRQFQAQTIKDLNKASFLVCQRFPLGLWSLGFLFSVIGITIIGLVMMHKHIFLDEIDGLTYFTKMIISLLTLISGMIMLIVAKKEKLRINKNEDLIYVEYKNIFFRGHLEGRYLHSLKDFYVVKKGIQTFTENTIHYVIRFEFNDDFDNLEVAESRRFLDIKKKYIQICVYLDKEAQQMENIKFVDESQVTLNWKKRNETKKIIKKPPQLSSQNFKNPAESSLNSLESETVQNKQIPSKTQSLINSIKILKKFKVNDD